MEDKMRERFYDVFDTTTDYRKVKLTDEQREKIIDGITSSMDWEEVETFINKNLVRFGYEFNTEYFLWENKDDELLNDLRAVLRKYGL